MADSELFNARTIVETELPHDKGDTSHEFQILTDSGVYQEPLTRASKNSNDWL